MSSIHSQLSALRAWLPRGRSLPDRDWERRHRAMLVILWAYAVALPIFGLTQGFSPAAAFVPVLPIVIAGIAASLHRVGRRPRSVAVVFGLLTACAVLTSAWHGAIEAHFSYFVMIAVIALYEDWVAFGVAIAYVVAEHGVTSAVFPHSVYAHSGNPWLWSLVHGAFVAAAAAAAVVNWRLNEDMRVRLRAANRDVHETNETLRQAFEGGVAGMAIVSPDGRYLRVNSALCRMVGYTPDDLIGKTFQWLTHPSTRVKDTEAMTGLAEGRVDFHTSEKRYVHRDGHDVWVTLGANAVRDEEGKLAYVIAQTYDITERRRYEEQLQHRALHDPLTSLANRTLFADRAGHALARVQRHGGALSVLYVDLDRFKIVNDSLGHDVGDAVLTQTARRLTAAAREGDTLARLAGDEFTILCEDASSDDAQGTARRILEAFTEPFAVDGHEFELSVSVGIRTTDGADPDIDTLLRDAETALYRAKDRGRSRIEAFDSAARTTTVENRLATEHALRLALRNGELRVHYQPAVTLGDRQPIGVEALVRWEHPKRGLIPPAEFIPVAEESELIVELGEWVLEQACGQLADWLGNDAVTPDLRVAVNVSARQISRPELPDTVARVLGRTGLDGRHLCLEVTESSLVREPEVAVANLVALKAQGVLIAIDDFGVGFSSLDQIRSLPAIDVIKVDRSFTAGLGRSATDEAIVTAVLSLAASLGAVSVVEGIEDSRQLELLRAMGGQLAQGFYFSRPLPAGAVLPALVRGTALPLEVVDELRNAA
jgi:diguanylate cyclase (GGDEF)-like protein/PAS domain S-box-containing protein